MDILRWPGDDRDPIRLEYHGSPLHWSFREHGHRNFWELTYVVRGCLTHVVNGVVLEQHPGSLTIIRERDRHSLAGQGITLINLGFVSSIPDLLATLPRRAEDTIGWLKDHPGPVSCRIPEVERVQWLASFDRLGAAIGGVNEVPALLAIFAQAMLTCRQAAEVQHGIVNQPDWMGPLQALLHDFERDVPDLSALRQQAGVSREHLARSFRRHLGMSPSQFINRCRAIRLEHHLRTDPERPIGAIAEQVGFASLTHAERCFRTAFGASPREWRRQQGHLQVTEARQAELYHQRHPQRH